MSDKITWEMFREYHYSVGEDFFDQTGEGNHLIFGGYLLAKYPEFSKEILEICNSKYGECQYLFLHHNPEVRFHHGNFDTLHT
jgi:hypothetical protein